MKERSVEGPFLPLETQTIEVRRDLFGEGTIGYDIISDELEGRQRPLPVFKRRLGDFLLPGKERHNRFIASELARRVEKYFGISTVEELMFYKPMRPNLDKTRVFRTLKRSFCNLTNFLLTGPEAKLVDRIFVSYNYQFLESISPEAETARSDAVGRIIGQLGGKERCFFPVYYGLVDWIIRNYEEASRLCRMTESETKGINPRVMKFLKLPENAKQLEVYHALDRDSLGRAVLGLTCLWDGLRFLGQEPQSALKIMVGDVLSLPKAEETRIGYYASQLNQRDFPFLLFLKKINKGEVSVETVEALQVGWKKLIA